MQHWRLEFAAIQRDATRHFTPSMRQKIDVARHYSDALGEFEDITIDCTFTLDQLLQDKRAELEERLRAASTPPNGSAVGEG